MVAPPAPTMEFLSRPAAARALWAAPALLLLIAVLLVRAGGEQRRTAEVGTVVQARVVDLELRERSEITHGVATFRYAQAAGDSVDRPVELPLAFLKEIELGLAQDSSLVVPIRVDDASDQIVLDAYSRTTWVMTYAFAAMSAIGALGLAWLVAGWNRFLAREGDPSQRVVADGS